MRYIITACFLLLLVRVQAQQLAPRSGFPLMSGTVDGIGKFALPSLTAAVMGTALVNDDSEPDLFLQADVRRPGTYLYHFKKLATNGAPVFSKGIKINLPFPTTEEEPKGIIYEDKKQHIYGVWRSSKAISIATFNRKTLEFENLKTIKVTNLPRQYSSIGLMQMQSGKFLLLFTIAKPGVYDDNDGNADNSYYRPDGMWPYELPSCGVYGALISDLETVQSVTPVPLTSLDEAYYGISGYTDYQHYILAGTRLGNILAYEPGNLGAFLPKKYIIDTAGNLMRNPVVNTYPAYFKGSTKEGLITSGEGGIYFYANMHKKDSRGNLVFGNPVDLLQENPELHAGSLVVPEMVDWDGDGLIDIIVGNSAGKIYFIKNSGTNQVPAFDRPIALKAGGVEIHIQPGYREDIQGPGESRWGYVCPAVIDWNKDGLPDILTDDSRGKFMVFLNVGTINHPVLAKEHPLYFNGMDVHGGWRSRPGAAKLAGKMAYVITDRDNEFHLYWQLDQYNLSDGGKLTIGDSVAIKAHRRSGGQVGRAKTLIVDWDGDGVKDMLIGTGRGAAIPNPINGLPYNRKVKNEGAAVLFLKNTGTEEKPVFAFPKMMKFKGKDILLGAHECAPSTTTLGGDGKTLNLVVGTEYGNFIFYDRKDLSWE